MITKLDVTIAKSMGIDLLSKGCDAEHHRYRMTGVLPVAGFACICGQKQWPALNVVKPAIHAVIHGIP